MKNKLTPFAIVTLSEVQEWLHLTTDKTKTIVINKIEYVVPAWANYLAVDSNNEVWLYEEEPEFLLGTWHTNTWRATTERETNSKRFAKCTSTGSPRLSLSKLQLAKTDYNLAMRIAGMLLVLTWLVVVGTYLGKQ